MKTPGRKLKATDTISANPNRRDQEQREMLPSGPPRTTEFYNPTQQNVITVQNNHLTRLRYLFPEINAAYLHMTLDLCQGDFIRTIDHILNIRRNGFMREMYGNRPPSAGLYRHWIALPHPSTSAYISLNSNNMVQTSHKMPPVNQTLPFNYHTNQYPVIKNPMLMQGPVVVQGSNFPATSQFIQNSSKFSEPVPSHTSPNFQPNVPVHVSTLQQSTEQSKPAPASFSDMPQPFLHKINDHASNVYGQQFMKSPQMDGSILAQAKKQNTVVSHLTASDISEQPRNTNDQVIERTIPETFARQQTESCQQDQCDKNQIFELLNNMQPMIHQQLRQGVCGPSATDFPPPSACDVATTPTHTVFAPAVVQCQEGKLGAENSQSYMNIDDLIPAEGSAPWQAENQQCNLDGRNNNSDTSHSEDSLVITEIDGDHHSSSDNGLGK